MDLMNAVIARTVITGSAGGVKPHIEKYSPPLEKCVGHILKLLYIVQKYLPP